METRIWKIHHGKDPGHFRAVGGAEDGLITLDTWEIPSDAAAEELQPLRDAAEYLKHSDIPVAFPTETVYGLGADATRSRAVKGIYAAKGRPSDNPLIVHVCDLDMLRGLLAPATSSTPTTNGTTNGDASNYQPGSSKEDDPIPQIYKPLLQRFWPGPLTILLRNPQPSALAPEVTAGLTSFGARMPASVLARTLIKLAGAPLAAPSANASTKPSPTTAQHVLDDLEGRIGLILDGGPCTVGVESTVVDGLCDPPVVLRPGGVSIEELRNCVGWEGVLKAYKDQNEMGSGENGKMGTAAPRAPGMKYKHYSPKAKVVLCEAASGLGSDYVQAHMRKSNMLRREAVGVIRTHKWSRILGKEVEQEGVMDVMNEESDLGYKIHTTTMDGSRILDISLGQDTRIVAQGLFSALRELDRKGVDIIFIEGIEDKDDIAAAVMNRLRKAASEIRL